MEDGRDIYVTRMEAVNENFHWVKGDQKKTPVTEDF